MTQPDRPLFTEDTGKRDAAWVQAALSGDYDAFGRLVAAYQRAAVSTAYRLLGNSDDAAETAQGGVLRAYRALDRLKDPARFGPWLLRTVCNLALNARRSRRARDVAGTRRGTGHRGLGGPARSVESHLDDPGPRDRRPRASDRRSTRPWKPCPRNNGWPWCCSPSRSWAQKDIAELLECSLETVKWNVFQARKKLRERWGT